MKVWRVENQSASSLQLMLLKRETKQSVKEHLMDPSSVLNNTAIISVSKLKQM